MAKRKKRLEKGIELLEKAKAFSACRKCSKICLIDFWHARNFKRNFCASQKRFPNILTATALLCVFTLLSLLLAFQLLLLLGLYRLQ